MDKNLFLEVPIKVGSPKYMYKLIPSFPPSGGGAKTDSKVCISSSCWQTERKPQFASRITPKPLKTKQKIGLT